MSKRIGMNVALGLNAAGFNKGVNQAKSRLDQFGKDVKRQNELLSKFGAAGLGRGFGIAGGALEAVSMGGAAGALGGLAVAMGGLVMSVKAVMSAIDGMNKSVLDARKAMQSLEEGKALPGTISGFTPSAAKAITTTNQTDIFSEALASNLAPRSLEDAIVGYVTSAAPNVWRAWAAESINIMTDALLGRQSGGAGQRMQAAAMATVAGDLGPVAAQLANDNLERIRRGQDQQNQILRGN